MEGLKKIIRFLYNGNIEQAIHDVEVAKDRAIEETNKSLLENCTRDLKKPKELKREMNHENN